MHTQTHNQLGSKRIIILLAGFILSSFLSLLYVPQAQAISYAGFDPGKIIDDSVFTDNNAMNVTQVQAFLNAKGGDCTVGNCLKSYSEGGRSAAQIIVDTAHQYRINPQVFIVLLQKESGLVTVNNPASWRYQTATGYGCPDTAACDSKYFGLTNQLRWSGTMFRAIIDRSPTWYSPYVVGNNRIFYHPGPTINGVKRDINYCGSSTVNIKNWSTAALYSYTPYQPNQSALAAGYGTGDACASYGNRNFYAYFTDWFGSTLTTSCTLNEPIEPTVASFYNPRTGDHFYTPYYCEGNVVRLKLGYINEGAVFNTSSSSLPGAVPVWRLYNKKTTQHLWTTQQDEIESAQKYAGYELQGIAFHTAPNVPGTQPVYRLYNHKTYQHVWTPNLTVANFIAENVGFKFEGVAFYSQ